MDFVLALIAQLVTEGAGGFVFLIAVKNQAVGLRLDGVLTYALVQCPGDALVAIFVMDEEVVENPDAFHLDGRPAWINLNEAQCPLKTAGAFTGEENHRIAPFQTFRQKIAAAIRVRRLFVVLAVLVKQTHNQRKMTGIDTQNFHVFIFALSAAGRNS